jgi:hypothetical protein
MVAIRERKTHNYQMWVSSKLIFQDKMNRQMPAPKRQKQYKNNGKISRFIG